MMARRCSCISSTPIRCHDVRMHSGPDWPCDDNKPCAWATRPLSEGDPGAISQKKIGAPFRVAPPISPSPAASSALKPKASRIHPTGSPNSPFHSRGRGTPPHPPAPNTTEAASERRPSHSRIFSRPHSQPLNSARQSHPHTHDEWTTDRPTGDCAFAPRLSSVAVLSRLRLAGWDWPAQPNLRQIGVRLGHLSISSQSPACIGVQPHFFPRCDGKVDGRGARTKKKKVSKRLSRARALVDSLFCCCFCFGLFLLHIPPPFVCFCCCIIVPTLSFSGLDGAAAQRGPTRRGLLLLAGWDDGIYPLFWTWFFDDDGWGGGFNTEQGRGAAAASPYIGFGMTQQQHR